MAWRHPWAGWRGRSTSSLIDAGIGHRQGFHPSDWYPRKRYSSSSGNSTSITEAYTAIKKLSQRQIPSSLPHPSVNKVLRRTPAPYLDNMALVAAQKGIAETRVCRFDPL